MTSCTLCAEIERGYVEIDGINYGTCDIYKKDNFIVKPTLGPLVEGHCIILTEDHYINLGEVPKTMHAELEQLVTRVETALQQVYHSPTLFFEHGPAPGNRAGCCVDHAHLHAMPIEGPLKEWVAQDAREITNFDALSELYARYIPYLFFQENDGKRGVIELTDNIISQYIRKIIAQHKGLSQLDWRQDLNVPCVLATYEKMRRAMQS